MSESEGSARPRQLTMAGWFVVAGSVLLLFTVFDSLTGLYSVQTREDVAQTLSTPTGEGLGLSVAQALSVMRVGLMVAAGCAAATAVLGVFVLQRHRGARIVLSVLAVPILLTSPLTGVVAALIAASTLVLWTGPARDWFAGRPVREQQPLMRRGGGPDAPGRGPDREPPRPPAGPASPHESPRDGTSTPVDLSTQATSSQPVATSGFGQRPDQQPPPGGPPAQWGPPGNVPPGWHPPAPTDVMPVQVRVACLLTWAFSGVVALMYAAVLLVLLFARDQVVDLVVSSPEWERANLDSDILVPVLWVGCLLFLAWSTGAMLLAWFTWRRHNWARYLLVASAGVALVAGLFAFPFGLFHQLACLLTITSLFTARAREWFAPRMTGFGAPPGPPYGPPPTQGPPDQQGRPPVW